MEKWKNMMYFPKKYIPKMHKPFYRNKIRLHILYYNELNKVLKAKIIVINWKKQNNMNKLDLSTGQYTKKFNYNNKAKWEHGISIIKYK